MKISDIKPVSTIIREAKKNSMSYEAYRNLVSDLVEEQSTTGNEKTEELINYTQLNDRRMKRWDKTIKISDAAQNIIDTSTQLSTGDFESKVTWLVITESWCGDAAHIMPVINKVANLNNNIKYEVVLRDDNNELMNAFLTNGSKSIPKLIMMDDKTDEVINTFGPRPTAANNLVNAYKLKHGKLNPEFKEDLQRWYNKDKGQSTVEDLIDLLK